MTDFAEIWYVGLLQATGARDESRGRLAGWTASGGNASLIATFSSDVTLH